MFLSFFYLTTFSVKETFAANFITNPLYPEGGNNVSGANFIESFVPSIITILFIIGSIIFVFFLILGAIQWITSGGDKIANEQARRRITHALIGIIILFSVIGIRSFIEYLFDIPLGSFSISELNIYPGTPPTTTPASEQDRCIAAGGTWRMFGDNCADLCWHPPYCSPAATFGCDCGAGGCWSDPNCI